MIMALNEESQQATEYDIKAIRKSSQPLNRVYFPETWIWHCFTLRGKQEIFQEGI